MNRRSRATGSAATTNRRRPALPRSGVPLTDREPQPRQYFGFLVLSSRRHRHGSVRQTTTSWPVAAQKRPRAPCPSFRRITARASLSSGPQLIPSDWVGPTRRDYAGTRRPGRRKAARQSRAPAATTCGEAGRHLLEQRSTHGRARTRARLAADCEMPRSSPCDSGRSSAGRSGLVSRGARARGRRRARRRIRRMPAQDAAAGNVASEKRGDRATRDQELPLAEGTREPAHQASLQRHLDDPMKPNKYPRGARAAHDRPADSPFDERAASVASIMVKPSMKRK